MRSGQVLTRKVYQPDGVTVVLATTNSYDHAGNLDRFEDGDGNVTSYTYNSDRQVGYEGLAKERGRQLPPWSSPKASISTWPAMRTGASMGTATSPTKPMTATAMSCQAGLRGRRCHADLRESNVYDQANNLVETIDGDNNAT